MKSTSTRLAALALALLSVPAAAQITILNSASGAANPFVTITGNPGTVAPGTDITIDTTIPQVGSGCASRILANANKSYIPCGSGVNPANGFTIQFWLRMTSGQQANGNPDYLFADASMVAPAAAGASGGVFRCFANGAAGAGALLFRGVSNQLVSAVGVIVVNTWTHVAYKYEPAPSNVLKLLINGVVTNTVAQTTTPFNWSGTNLSICGGNNSSASAGAYFMDDIRLYGFGRTDADIAGDYTAAASGLGPSGLPNLPDRAYFDLEGSVQPHFALVGTNTDALNTGVRLATGGTVIEWDGNSPAGDLPASCLINIYGPSLGNPAVDPYAFAYRSAPATPITYTTPGAPGVELGHGFSSPANPAAIAFPDGLGLGLFPGLVFFSVPGPYTYQSSPSVLFALPAGIFAHGDHIQQQWIAPDPAYPFGLGTSPRAGFVYSDCATVNPGAHAHIEARGNGAIQVASFWEIHNTGNVDITQVIIDTTTCAANGGTATGFTPAGFLNSGGNLAAGTSYRFLTETYAGLVGLPIGFTPIPAGSVSPTGLQFDFTNFTACTDEFVFDCESIPANTSGNAYIGATVTVTFASGPPLTGLMVADPSATNAAIINL